MRIAAGELKGRTFSQPKGRRAHPMSEQIRNALFNSLGDISGLTVFDAYAGSGGVAFEAASRGANKVYATEKDPRVFNTLKENRDGLGLNKIISISRANCISWVEQQNILFDIIIADPPFDQLSDKHITVLSPYLQRDGVFVISHAAKDNQTIVGFQKVSSNTFGNAALSFYKKS